MVKIGGLLASAVAAACWLVALFLPWTNEGALSSVSLLDAVEVIRRGSVDAVVPSGAAVVLLVPSIASIIVIGVVGLAGRGVAGVRAGALAVGSLGSIGLALGLCDADPAAAGPGAWMALLGVLFAAQALGCSGYATRSRQSSSP